MGLVFKICYFVFFALNVWLIIYSIVSIIRNKEEVKKVRIVFNIIFFIFTAILLLLNSFLADHLYYIGTLILFILWSITLVIEFVSYIFELRKK